MMDESEIQKQLLAAFQDEAQERIEALFSGLSSLEAADADELPEDVIESVFREAHSLKGAARSVNLPVIESLCQEMESIFAAIQSSTLQLSAPLFDTLHAATRLIEKTIDPEADAAETDSAITQLVRSLKEAKTRTGAEEPSYRNPAQNFSKESPDEDHETPDLPLPDTPSPAQPKEDPSFSSEAPDTDSQQTAKPLFSTSVRIPAAKLDALLLKTEELITIKQAAHQQLKRIESLDQTLQEWRHQWDAFQRDFRKVKDRYAPAAGVGPAIHFIDDTREFIRDFDHQLKQTAAAAGQDSRQFSGLIDDLLAETKNTSLMPFSGLFTVFPRMVREIARDRGKSVDLRTDGESVEIDKRILEGLKDPLTHLLRNAIDHGIESPEVRTARGKPAAGSIRIIVSQPESRQVCIEIADDGNGIDIDAVKAGAVKKGIISAADAEAAAEADALNLIFQSGVSSSAMVTQISGRGLGMPILRDALDHLGGRLQIRSEPGKGTAFLIHLPVTLATFRGVLVDVSGHLLILPNAQIQHSLKIRPQDIQTVESQSIIYFNRRPTALVHLADVLGIPKPAGKNGGSGKTAIPVVILETEATEIAFCVDEVLTEQEVLVKPLGRQLKKVRHFAGATILGNGMVVPVLNVKDLIKTASGQSFSIARPPADSPAEPSEAPKSVLIVEDSFTSRTLLKNILEASGYHVKTAIDGADGLSQLKTRGFDGVVSDVEMPRMNGFELTASIRADKSLAGIPVILVTSLDSPADREQGVEAGADAYIVKSSFDQSNLIEVLDRLL
ncbi:MAG: response regulator [Desulfobacterales bacterium]